MKIVQLYILVMPQPISLLCERSPLIYSVEMVILPSQFLKDFSLMILTNFLPLWNETALRPEGGGLVSLLPNPYSLLPFIIQENPELVLLVLQVVIKI